MNGQRLLLALRALLIALAASVSVFSCEMSSGFLSASERSTLYTLTLNAADGSALSDGVVLPAGTGIAAIVAKTSGAGDPATLDFALASLGGASVTKLRLAAPGAKADPAASKSVASIDGKLEGFAIPADLASGAYELSVSISGPDGSLLLQEKFNLFVGGSRPVINSVSAFPPAVEPGTAVLLSLTVSWLSSAKESANSAAVASAAVVKAASLASGPASTLAPQGASDPWIRWSKDGVTFAEGLLSAGKDKVVWSAPRTEGAYSITAEVFPSAPLKGASFSFKASASQDLKVMVIAAPGGSGNDFADPLAFYSLLRLDGSFDDIGTRPRSIQPDSFGSPLLDTYSSGFGYRFGPSAGVNIPGLMPPSSSGNLSAFSVILRLDSNQSDGTLVSFASNDGSYVLVLGIKDWKPYAETTVFGKTLRSTASIAIPQPPLTIVASLKPVGDRLSISWSAEGERIDAPSLPLPPAPPDGRATLGGAGSLPGVYDGFGLMLGSSPPSYRLASRRKLKSSLIIAESFEDGVLPALSVAAGAVSLASGALELGPGASLSLAPSFNLASALVVEADIQGDRASCYLVLTTPEGARILSVGGRGDVLNASGAAAGSIDPADGRIAFTLEQKEAAIYLRGAGGSDPVVVPSSAKRLVLSLERTGGVGGAAINRVLVRISGTASSR
jgi:hypothetical protein